jgi:hypothetical protein
VTPGRPTDNACGVCEPRPVEIINDALAVETSDPRKARIFATHVGPIPVGLKTKDPWSGLPVRSDLAASQWSGAVDGVADISEIATVRAEWIRPMTGAGAAAEVAADIDADPIHRYGSDGRCLHRQQGAGRGGRRIAPMITSLDEDAVTLRREAGVFAKRRCSYANVIECCGTGSSIPGPVASADADIPVIGDVVSQAGLKHDTIARGRRLRDKQLANIMIVQTGERRPRHVRRIACELQSVGQHVFGRQTNAQRVEVIFLRYGGISPKRNTGVGTCQLPAIVGVRGLNIIAIADERAELGAR